MTVFRYRYAADNELRQKLCHERSEKKMRKTK